MDRNATLLTLPASLQSKLPRGAHVLATDGTVEMYKIGANQWQQRQFELGPLPYRSELSARTWTGQSQILQNLPRAFYADLPIEQFNGHVVTLFILYIPTPGKTNSYTPEIFAVYSWTSKEWIWIKNPAAIAAMLKPESYTTGRAGGLKL